MSLWPVPLKFKGMGAFLTVARNKAKQTVQAIQHEVEPSYCTELVRPTTDESGWILG